MIHSFPLRIYYEDTDAGGIVYHANYLKFAERARTEWLRELGYGQHDLRKKEGIIFVVRSMTIDYHLPAFLDDQLTVETRLHETGKVRITLKQTLKRAEKTLSEMTVHLVSIGENGRPVPLLPELLEKLKK